MTNIDVEDFQNAYKTIRVRKNEYKGHNHMMDLQLLVIRIYKRDLNELIFVLQRQVSEKTKGINFLASRQLNCDLK